MIMTDQHLYFNQNTLLLTVVVDSYKSTYIHNETFIIQLYFEFYKSSKICKNLNIKFFINVERTRDLYLLSNIYCGSPHEGNKYIGVLFSLKGKLRLSTFSTLVLFKKFRFVV